MAVKREVYEALDGFDPAYRNGNEDLDFCLRVRQRGWQIVYVAESVVVHYESQSGAARWQYVDANVRLLNERWVAHEDSETSPDPLVE